MKSWSFVCLVLGLVFLAACSFQKSESSGKIVPTEPVPTTVVATETSLPISTPAGQEIISQQVELVPTTVVQSVIPEPVQGDSDPLLVFGDEFDGPSGQSPDPAKWTFDIGGEGWGNNELEYYTNSSQNAALDGAGNLVITARKENYGGQSYTSARLKTQGLFAQRYGRFEARFQIPKGQGLWPAFWLLGANIDQVGWPDCGEIDIMEILGQQPNKAYFTNHWGNQGGHQSVSGDVVGADFSTDFHVISVDWSPGLIVWSVDGTETFRSTTGVTDQAMFLLLNLAVGGDWPGSPDQSTSFPSSFKIDYVRVYSH